MRVQSLKAAVGAACSLGAGSAAAAISELALDVNTIRIQATSARGTNSAFSGVTHTGSLVMHNGPFTALAGVSVDGASKPITPGLGILTGGQIDLYHGAVTGGFLSILMGDGSSFLAEIVGGEGRVTTQVGQGFKIDGLLTNAGFADLGGPGTLNKFAGVDISAFKAEAPIVGSFLTFAYSPNAGGLDRNADLDLVMHTDGPVVPLPSAGAMALAGGVWVGSRRRRMA